MQITTTDKMGLQREYIESGGFSTYSIIKTEKRLLPQTVLRERSLSKLTVALTMDCQSTPIPARYTSNETRMVKSFRPESTKIESLFATLIGIIRTKIEKAENPLKKESFMFKSSSRNQMVHGIETANMPVICLRMK